MLKLIKKVVLFAAVMLPLAPLVRAVLRPLNAILARILVARVIPNSALHISYMVHIPYESVGQLRRQGMRADYLAIGRSSHWDKSDYVFVPSPLPWVRALQEFWLFWSVIARYEVIHAHFMYSISDSGWEWGILRSMGRRIVAHFRGCEARDRERNMTLHPDVNICQTCEHRPYICQTQSAANRRAWGRKYADVTLVTTPDMKDFLPAATHIPFFAPDVPEQAPKARESGKPFIIVHITNQPGIEGTEAIAQVIERLKARSYNIDFRWIRNVKRDEALAAIAGADLAIGKMKMGYYANAQIETMSCGVPTVTHVRDEFMSDDLCNSGFIFTTLPNLEDCIAYYIDNPEALRKKRDVARSSILNLHDNARIARKLMDIYRGCSVASVKTSTPRRSVAHAQR